MRSLILPASSVTSGASKASGTSGASGPKAAVGGGTRRAKSAMHIYPNRSGYRVMIGKLYLGSYPDIDEAEKRLVTIIRTVAFCFREISELSIWQTESEALLRCLAEFRGVSVDDLVPWLMWQLLLSNRISMSFVFNDEQVPTLALNHSND